MQLKTSYFSKTIFLKNIARFWPVWAVYLLIWLFAMPVNLWSSLTAPDLVAQGSSFVESAITLQIYRGGFTTGSIMAAVFGILAAMAVFSYLYVNKSACMYHMLPVKREGLFLSNYLSGLLFLVGPNVIVFVISAIVKSVCGYADLGALWAWLGLVSAMSLFFYSFGVFCAMFTGHILALPVFYGILNFIVVGIELLVKMVLSTFVFGMTYNNRIALGFLSPFYEINSMTTTLNDKIVCWNVMTGYAIAGLVFAALALLIYRKRHVETAGDVIAVRPVKPVFKYGAAFSAALLLGYILYGILGRGSDKNGVWIILACMLPAGFVGYFAAEMLLKKSFHVIKSGIRGWLIFSGILILLITAMKLDVFGYERHIPNASNVREAVVGRYINLTSTGALTGYNNNSAVITGDDNKIQEIVALHENIVKNKAMIENFDFNDSTSEGVYSWNGASVAIYYMMKDGSMIYRSYTIPVTEELLADTNSPAAEYEAFLNAPDNIRSRNFPNDLSKNNFGNGEVRSDYDRGITSGYVEDGISETLALPSFTLSQDESYRLYLAIIKDIEAGNIGKTYLRHNDEYYNTVYTYAISLRFEGDFPGWNGDIGDENIPKYANFQIEKNSANTIAALKDMGFLDDNQLITQAQATNYNEG